MNRLAPLAAALALFAAPAHAETILVNDGRVVTNTAAGVLERGDVLIRDGRIAAVGASIAPPPGARVVEAAGKWVTPGVFGAMSQVGLAEVPGSGAPDDASVRGDKVSAGADAARAYNPRASAVAVTRIEGVTRAAIAPHAVGTIFQGRGALVALDDAAGVFAPRAFQVVALGEEGAGRAGSSRASLWPVFEAALKDAREYPARYTSGQGGAVLDEIDAAALKPFALGQGLFVVRIDRASDIRELLKFARANPSLKFAIHGAAEGWLVAKDLAASKIPVMVDPLANLPSNMERISARLDNAALLERAGVRVTIAPDPGNVDGQQTRLALQLAGNAVANGLPWDAAFRAITLEPARLYGVDKDLGALAVGKIADVVVWDGDPLEVSVAPSAVFIAGAEVPLVSRQTRLRDRYNPAK